MVEEFVLLLMLESIAFLEELLLATTVVIYVTLVSGIKIGDKPPNL
jgi:hypothetical protein